jgi:hypothetical protein
VAADSEKRNKAARTRAHLPASSAPHAGGTAVAAASSASAPGSAYVAFRAPLKYKLGGPVPLTLFQQWWARQAEDLGLRVQVPFQIAVGQRMVEVPVLLEDFGAQRGMLLVTEWSTIAAIEDQLVALGFGYSCLSEPSEMENREGLAGMLSDWGWYGAGQPSPQLSAFLEQRQPRDDTA